jgi:hypothetical protein
MGFELANYIDSKFDIVPCPIRFKFQRFYSWVFSIDGRFDGTFQDISVPSDRLPARHNLNCYDAHLPLTDCSICESSHFTCPVLDLFHGKSIEISLFSTCTS